MRKALTILLLMCFAFFANAQSDDSGNALYPNNFSITHPVIINNKVVITPSGFSGYMKGSFGITVSGMYKPYFSDIKTSVVVVSRSGDILASVDGPSFNRSDFTIGGVVYNNSTYKEFNLQIPRHSTIGYSQYKDSQVIIRYKYYFNPAVGIPNQETAGWAPKVTFNREWFIHDKKYTITLADPVTSINGPNAICDEANYSIINPGTVTLENADGIATLTQLSNSQWKIERIGTASGFVKLRSSLNGNKIEKEVAVGTPRPAIVGPANITAPTTGKIQDYSFSIDTIPGATYQWSFEGSSNVSFQSSTTSYSTTILVKSHTGTAPYYCKLRLKVTTECGTSDFIDYNVKITPAQGGVLPPDL
ncbi:MAG: hypothetical protein ACN6PN_00100 [Sphingobacterium sp.]